MHSNVNDNYNIVINNNNSNNLNLGVINHNNTNALHCVSVQFLFYLLMMHGLKMLWYVCLQIELEIYRLKDFVVSFCLL